jgi:hypothetical protein
VLFSSILRRKKWTLPAVIASFLIWLIEYWVERLAFQTSRANLPFAMICSILLITIAWIIAILPGAKSYFAKSEEHEQPVKKPDTA